MAKFNLNIKYLCQDRDGNIHVSINKPKIMHNEWMNCDWYFFAEGNYNEDWINTLIDLGTDDYEFEDGILRRIEK